MADLVKKLLERKVGGTMLGNTVRGLVKTASNGILGNGVLMKKTEDSTPLKSAVTSSIAQMSAPSPDPIVGSRASGSSWFQKNMALVVGGAFAAAIGLMLIIKKIY